MSKKNASRPHIAHISAIRRHVQPNPTEWSALLRALRLPPGLAGEVESGIGEGVFGKEGDLLFCGRLARSKGHTTDPSDDPVLIRPLQYIS